MAIVELQISIAKFCQYLSDTIEAQRLPSPEALANTAFANVHLERFECVSCAVRPSAGAGQLTVDANVVVYYHPALNDVSLAGSLQPPPGEALPTPVTITVTCIPTVAGKVEIAWHAALLPEAVPVAFPLPDDIHVMSAAIEATAEVVAVRIGTQTSDPVRATPIDRLGGSDWRLVLPGALFVESLVNQLDASLHAAEVPGDVEMTKRPRGSWQPIGPTAAAWGEITKIDGCKLFGVDMPIDFNLQAQFAIAGRRLTTTATLSWEPDSTWCDIVAGLTFVTFAGYVFGGAAAAAGVGGLVPWVGVGVGATVDVVAEGMTNAEVREKIRKKAHLVSFTETGHTDDTITYEQIVDLPALGEGFALQHSEVNFFGLVLSGTLERLPHVTLEGTSQGAGWSSEISCKPAHVAVVWNPPTVMLRAVNSVQPPKLFEQKTQLSPPNAWRLQSEQVANTITITFLDPVGGRLAAGLPTSVVLCTDLGVRWVDLGIIPADDVSANLEDLEATASKFCESLSRVLRRAADKLVTLDWMVDPLHDPDPEGLLEFAPLRLWQLGIPARRDPALIDFYVVGSEGFERRIGTVDGTEPVALPIVTRGDEVIGIRAQHEAATPRFRLTQAWVSPLSMTKLDGLQVGSFSAADASFALTRRGQSAPIASLSGQDMSISRMSAESTVPAGLAPAAPRSRAPMPEWARTFHIDRNSVAFVHDGRLVLGEVGTRLRIV